MKILKTVSISILLPLLLFAQAYVSSSPDHIAFGNKNFELEFDLSTCFLKPVWLNNKINQNKYRLSGNLFTLTVTFPGEGITPPKNVPQVFTAADFILDTVKHRKTNDGLQLTFFLSGQGLKLKYTFFIPQNRPFFRIMISAKDDNNLQPFLGKISPWNVQINGLHPMHGGFGQPVFGDDLFMGVEFPAAHNDFKNNQINCWHYVAQKLNQKNYYVSHPVVVGFSESQQIKPAFFNYIKTLRPRLDDPFVLYNTWYDIRDFSYPRLLNTIRNFKSTLIDKYHLNLNAFVIDDGWDDVHSVWEINKQKFPQGFTPLVNELKKMHSALGLWISPWNGYDQARNQRVKWAAAHGFKTSAGRHLCLGDTNYFKIFKQKVLQYQKQAHLSFYKIDGFLSICNETDHNHLPGIYSGELLTRRFIEILQALRKQSPDIFIDITVGTWLSPWWLQYADAVWMTGADYGHAEDVPAFSERDKAITFRDYTLYKDFVRDQLQFPLTNVMTHGIIKGKLNLLGGKDETLQNWMDNAVMYFSRGVMMWELYLSPEVLTVKEWDFLAKVMKWAKSNTDILTQSRFIGGDPYQRQIYGYVHQKGNEALIVLRNPFVRPQEITLSQKELFDPEVKGTFAVETLYPNYRLGTQKITRVNPLKCTLQGYEVRVLRLTPELNLPPLPQGIYLAPVSIKGKKSVFEAYLDPAENPKVTFRDLKKLKKLTFYGKPVNLSVFETIVKNVRQRSGKAMPSVSGMNVQFSSVSPTQISGRIQADTIPLWPQGRLGILLDFTAPADSLKIECRQNGRELAATVKKGAEGLWYWILVPEKILRQPLDFKIASASEPMPHGQLSIWNLYKKPLAEIGLLGIEAKNNDAFIRASQMPAAGNYKRMTRLILQTDF